MQAATALLALLGVGSDAAAAVDAVTAADCLAAGYTCAQCRDLGFDTACVCPAGSPTAAQKAAADGLVAASKQCTWYNPRTKPWYVQAATGPKDVVVVFDTSGSMNVSESRRSPCFQPHLCRFQSWTSSDACPARSLDA
eukprot:SAG22_NODE_231_length_14551_cov_22.298090_5_plen_139_part_00